MFLFIWPNIYFKDALDSQSRCIGRDAIQPITDLWSYGGQYAQL
jgi:hypothetical protein